MKLYLFNHQDHTMSKYFKDVNSIGVFLLGKRLSNYSVIVCDKHNKPNHIINCENLPNDVWQFQEELKEHLEEH